MFDCDNFLCVFHILRAVRIQVISKAISKQAKDLAINTMHHLCIGVNSQDDTQRIIHNFQNQLQEMKETELYNYFQKHWFRPDQIRKWCASFKANHSKTNNISESLNNKIKNDYRLTNVNLRVDELAQIIIRDICPDYEFDALKGKPHYSDLVNEALTNEIKKSPEQLEYEATLRALYKISLSSPRFPYLEATLKLNAVLKSLDE